MLLLMRTAPGPFGNAPPTAAAAPAPPAADSLFGGGDAGGADDLFGGGGSAQPPLASQPNAPPAADALFGGPSAGDASGLFGAASGAAPWQPAPGSDIFTAPPPQSLQAPTPTAAATAPTAADLFGGPATEPDSLFGADPSLSAPPAATDLFGATAPAEPAASELFGAQPAAAVGGAAEGAAATATEEESPWIMDYTPEGYQCASAQTANSRWTASPAAAQPLIGHRAPPPAAAAAPPLQAWVPPQARRDAVPLPTPSCPQLPARVALAGLRLTSTWPPPNLRLTSA